MVVVLEVEELAGVDFSALGAAAGGVLAAAGVVDVEALRESVR